MSFAAESAYHRRMPPFRPSHRFAAFVLLSATAGALTACQPPRPAPKDPAAVDAAALEAHGYTHAPVITAIAAAGHDFIEISGTAPADSRVRFAFTDPLRSGVQAVGVTADAQGRFRAEVPIAAGGGLYDLTVDDGGRPRQAEGRLFVPPGRPDKAVLMRSGSASRLLQPQGTGIMVADYDAAGAFTLSGRTAPNAAVTVIVNDEIRALVQSDAQGVFEAATQVPQPGPAPQAVNVIVQVDKASFTRSVQVIGVSGGGASDRVSGTPDGWRVDWRLPGGGSQSTLVFKE